MTGFAGCSSHYMVSRFTFGCYTVMAASTARSDACMVKLGASEASSTLMTGFTSFSGWYMVIWLSFGCCTVMAASTTCSDACMVKLGASECGCAMTQRTLACLRVSRESRSAIGARGDDA